MEYELANEAMACPIGDSDQRSVPHQYAKCECMLKSASTVPTYIHRLAKFDGAEYPKHNRPHLVRCPGIGW